MSKKISIVLTKYERHLVEKYGYPFDEVSDQLEKASETLGRATIKADRYWMELLLGDLSRSINREEIPDWKTTLAVNDIADRIQDALRDA